MPFKITQKKADVLCKAVINNYACINIIFHEGAFTNEKNEFTLVYKKKGGATLYHVDEINIYSEGFLIQFETTGFKNNKAKTFANKIFADIRKEIILLPIPVQVGKHKFTIMNNGKIDVTISKGEYFDSFMCHYDELKQRNLPDYLLNAIDQKIKEEEYNI